MTLTRRTSGRYSPQMEVKLERVIVNTSKQEDNFMRQKNWVAPAPAWSRNFLPTAYAADACFRSSRSVFSSPTGCQVIDIFTPPYEYQRVAMTRWYSISREPLRGSDDVYAAQFRTL